MKVVENVELNRSDHGFYGTELLSDLQKDI